LQDFTAVIYCAYYTAFPHVWSLEDTSNFSPLTNAGTARLVTRQVTF